MMNLLRASLLVMTLFFSACSTIRVNDDFITIDLDRDFVRQFRANSNYFYLYEPRHRVDYMVSMVRMNVFQASSTNHMGEILLSLGLAEKNSGFDCDAFYSKLTAEEKKIVESKMKEHPFICQNRGYTYENALASFSRLLPAQINGHPEADRHWAWFSATGDTEPLKRLLDNYLYNPRTCVDCIRWSYSSNARQNKDVKDYLLKYMDGKTDKEKQTLTALLP